MKAKPAPLRQESPLLEERVEKRLLHLRRHPKTRREFLEGLHEQVIKISRPRSLFPYACVEALDDLVAEIAQDQEKRPLMNKTAIIYLKHHFLEQPRQFQYTRRYQGKEIVEYATRFLGRRHLLKRFVRGETKPKPLPVNVTVDRKEVTFTLGLSSGLETKVFSYDNYQTAANIRWPLLETSIGVGIRRASVSGDIHFGTVTYHLGEENSGKYVLIFFSKKYIYPFDLFGELLFIRLSIEEVREKVRLSKVPDIITAIEEIDIEHESRALYKQLKSQWKKDPDRFACSSGLTYIVQANCRVKTNTGGRIDFTHYDGETKREGIFVSKDYRSRFVKLKFKGRFAVMYGRDGHPINAYEFSELPHYTYTFNKRLNFTEAGLVIIKSVQLVNQPQPLKQKIGGKIYQFSLDEVQKRYSSPPEQVAAASLLANTLTHDYELLVRETSGAVVSVPLVVKEGY